MPITARIAPSLSACVLLCIGTACSSGSVNLGHQPALQSQDRGAPVDVVMLTWFRPIGGVGNNPGSTPNDPELTIAPLAFDGPNDALVSGPNPRTISKAIAGGNGSNGQNAETNDPTLSAWVYVFGQFVDHDLGLAVEPLATTPISISVPAGDPVFPAGTTIAMTRAVRDARTNTIVNSSAGFLDLSQLYGSTVPDADALKNADGTLKSSDGGQALEVVDGVFVSGDPRVKENPELTAVTALFMREHNYWVARLKAQHATWTATQLYEMARAVTTAEYQNIVYAGFLPHLIGPVLGDYRGYDPSVNAQETQEFSTAAFRLHTQVADMQEGLSDSGAVTFRETLAKSFFNTPQQDETNGIDDTLRSLGAVKSQATDPFTVAPLRNLLFAGLVGGGVDRMDLIAIDIQRERDVGLSSLNVTRKALGMQPYTAFDQLSSDPVVQQLYASVYGNIDNVDLFMGGLAEDHAAGANVGPTFQAIIASQFYRERAGDRYFWRNQGFDAATAAMISATTLTTLMLRDTATTTLQPDLFVQQDFPSRVKAGS